MNYAKFFEARFKIVNKQGEVVPFILNPIQQEWLQEPALRKIELKARQEGFSSAILAKKTAKFLLMENRYIISLADIADNAIGLLDRVKTTCKHMRMLQALRYLLNTTLSMSYITSR